MAASKKAGRTSTTYEENDESATNVVKSLTLSSGLFGMDDYQDKKYLKKYGSHLEELECQLWSSEMADAIISYCPNITKLTMYTSDFRETGSSFLCYDEDDEDDDESTYYMRVIESLLYHLKGLVSLKIYGERENFPYNLVRALPTSMEEIYFSFTCRNKHSAGYTYNLSNFSNLQSFAVVGHTVSKNALVGIESLENLLHLDFSGISRGIHITNIEKMQHFTKLKTLKIPYCKIDDKLLIKIISNNRDLESLDISFILSITDDSVQAASTLPKLRVLNVSHLRSITLKSALQMPSLENLNCSFCKKVKDEGLSQIMLMAPKLQRLNVCFSAITEAFFQIASDAVENRENKLSLTIYTSFDWDDVCFEDESPLINVEYPWKRNYPSRRLFYEIADDDDDYYDHLHRTGYRSDSSDSEDDLSSS